MTDIDKNAVTQSADDNIDTLPVQKTEETSAEQGPARPHFRELLAAQIKKPAFWRQTLPTIIFSWLAPWLIFQVTNAHFSQTIALLITAIVPSLWSLFSVIRHRRLDWLAIFTVGGILLSVVTTLVLQDPRLLLLKDGFSMLELAFFFLILTVLPYKAYVAIINYLMHSFMPDESSKTSAMIEALSQSKFLLKLRIAYLIGALIFIGEFVLRTVLLYKLPIAQFLLISPIIARSFTFLLIGALLLMVILRRWRKWRKM